VLRCAFFGVINFSFVFTLSRAALPACLQHRSGGRLDTRQPQTGPSAARQQRLGPPAGNLAQAGRSTPRTPTSPGRPGWPPASVASAPQGAPRQQQGQPDPGNARRSLAPRPQHAATTPMPRVGPSAGRPALPAEGPGPQPEATTRRTLDETHDQNGAGPSRGDQALPPPAGLLAEPLEYPVTPPSVNSGRDGPCACEAGGMTVRARIPGPVIRYAGAAEPGFLKSAVFQAKTLRQQGDRDDRLVASAALLCRVPGPGFALENPRPGLRPAIIRGPRGPCGAPGIRVGATQVCLSGRPRFLAGDRGGSLPPPLRRSGESRGSFQPPCLAEAPLTSGAPVLPSSQGKHVPPMRSAPRIAACPPGASNAVPSGGNPRRSPRRGVAGPPRSCTSTMYVPARDSLGPALPGRAWLPMSPCRRPSPLGAGTQLPGRVPVGPAGRALGRTTCPVLVDHRPNLVPSHINSTPGPLSHVCAVSG